MGNLWRNRTTTYDAWTTARFSFISLAFHVTVTSEKCSRRNELLTLTAETDAWASIEWQITPSPRRRILIQRQVIFFPPLWTKVFRVDAIQFLSPMKRVNAISHSFIFPNHYRRLSTWTPTCRKRGSLGSNPEICWH